MTCDPTSTASPTNIPDFINRHVSQTSTVSDVATLLASHALAFAWVPLGGTGARQQIFRLPGNLRVVFQFNGDDRLVSYGAYRSNETRSDAPDEAFDGIMTFAPAALPP